MRFKREEQLKRSRLSECPVPLLCKETKNILRSSEGEGDRSGGQTTRKTERKAEDRGEVRISNSFAWPFKQETHVGGGKRNCDLVSILRSHKTFLLQSFQ